MLTGIMAIFEMGLSLTGQTLSLSLPDPYLPGMKARDETLLIGMSGDNEETFKDSVLKDGLCRALEKIEPGEWELIEDVDAYWDGSCQLTEGSHRIIVTKDTHQFFSCVLRPVKSKCSFEDKDFF